MTLRQIWFGIRSVDYVNPAVGGGSAAQLDVLARTTDFAHWSWSNNTVDIEHVQYRQLLAFAGNAAQQALAGVNLADGVVNTPEFARAAESAWGDLRVGGGVVAHNLADMENFLTRNLSGIDRSNDPVRVTGHGWSNFATLAAAPVDDGWVTFSHAQGFGLRGLSGAEKTANAERLNDGESVTFRIEEGRVLAAATFTVRTVDGSATALVLDHDGVVLRDTNGGAAGGGAREGSAGELVIAGVANGARVALDFAARSVTVGGLAVASEQTAAFFDAFASQGAGRALTLGSLAGNQVGWSADDLILTTADAVPPNAAPVADDDAVALAGAGPTDITADLLAGDRDPEGGPLAIVSLGPVSGPGSAALSGGAVVFAADPDAHRALGQGETATARFAYTVRDAGGLEATATATVTITGANDAPIARPLAFIGSAQAGASGALLADDPDGDEPRFELIGLPALGSVSLDALGNFAFDPAGALDALGLGEAETVRFTYVARDAGGAVSEEAEVAITLYGGSAAPALGSAGNDSIGPDDAPQTIDPGPGNDTVDAGGGDDVVLFRPGEGNDRVEGGEGEDALVVAAGGAPVGPIGATVTGSGTVLIRAADGSSVEVSGVEEILIRGGDGEEVITVSGDLASAGVAQETVSLVGGAGDDVLDASGIGGPLPVRAVLHGGAGSDTLRDGTGSDILDAGPGADRIVVDGWKRTQVGVRQSTDIVVLRAGEVEGDVIAEFANPAWHRSSVHLAFVGFGEGAFLEESGGGAWRVVSGSGEAETFTLEGNPALDRAGYGFFDTWSNDLRPPQIAGVPDVSVDAVAGARDIAPDLLAAVSGPPGAQLAIVGARDAFSGGGQDYVLAFDPIAGTVQVSVSPELARSLATGGIVRSIEFDVGIAGGSGFVARAAAEIVFFGADDPAVIGGDLTGRVAEPGLGGTVGGRATVTDPDISWRGSEARFRDPDSLTGAYGSFTFDPLTGDWTYTADVGNPAVAALASGGVLVDELEVVSLDFTAARTIRVALGGDPGFAPVAMDALAAGDTGLGFRVLIEGEFGARLAAPVGDFTGDGFADLTVEAAHASFLLRGGAGASNLDLRTPSGAPSAERGWVLLAEEGRISGAGDVNGDGVGDLSVSSNRATVHFGGATGGAAPSRLNTWQPDPGFRVEPPTGGSLTTLLLAASDVNGDGFDDLADWVAAGGISQRLVVLFGGAGDGIGRIDHVLAGDLSKGFVVEVAPGIHHAPLPDPSQVFAAPWGGGAAGDVNGDGLADLLIATERWDEAADTRESVATVLFGSASPGAATLDGIGVSEPGLRVLLPATVSWVNGLNSEVAAGDVNGDGFADVIIAVPNASSGGLDRNGEVHIVFGSAAGGTVDLRGGEAPGVWTIRGGRDFQNLGQSVAGVGDANGDGYADILLGVPGYNATGGWQMSGAAFLLFGGPNPGPVDLDAIAAGASARGVMLLGEGRVNTFGEDVAAAGDVNGDGLADLLIADKSFSDDPKAWETDTAIYTVLGQSDWGV